MCRRPRVRRRGVACAVAVGVLLLVGPPAEVEAAAPSRGLVWSTFLGGGGEDNPAGIAVDDQGSSYVVGNTESPDFPPGGTLESGHAGFVTKLNPTGSETVYSTLIDLGKGALTGVAVDQEGHAYVSGYQAFGDDPRATAFVAKLDPTGSSFEYLAEIQASDEATFGLAVALDPQGNAYLTGYTGFLDSFPTTPGAFDSTFNGGFNDAYVAKFDPAGTLSYATLLGGGESDIGDSIAVGDDGSAVVSGSTESGDFPTTPGAADPTFAGAREAFVTRLNPAGSALVYSTFLGGGGDEPNAAVALDPKGNAYASGTTTSSDFPTTAGVADQTLGGASDGFVTKLAPAGSLVYSTFLGGSGADGGASVSVDEHGVAHVTGSTSSADFPVTPDALDPTYNGAGDAFVTALDASGSAPLYSTFLGGTAGDGGADVALEQGAIYTTGGTSSGDFPVTPGAFDTTHNGGTDVFVTKLTVPPAAEDPCDRPDAINGSGDIHGTPGDDVICGGPGPDHIDGRGGDDVIYARSGQDVVEGGAGDDFV